MFFRNTLATSTFPGLVGLVGAALLATSCGAGKTCVSGMASACSCTNGLMGAQACQADGTYGACQCGGSTVCNSANCAGCCDATGTCNVGTSTNACGLGGALCVACAGAQTCSSGVCKGGAHSGPDGGTECTGCAANQACTANGCVNAKRIFFTKTEYSGNLGGLTGADQKCATAAAAIGLGGVWKAWLSDSTTDALDRIAEVGPWYKITPNGLGDKVFNNKAGLATIPLAYVDRNETGTTFSTTGYAWTGTTVGGVKSAGYHCQDWTSSGSDYGRYGFVGANNAGWTNFSTDPCNRPRSIYCIEQ